MVSREIINKVITEVLKLKTHYTISEMHSILDGYTQEEKNTLLKYTTGWDELLEGYYERVLLRGDKEEIFQFESRILNQFKDRRRKNILTYLSDFNKMKYGHDDDEPYPSSNRGPLEREQEEIQESHGYTEEMVDAIKTYWTGGFYEEIQDYIRENKIPWEGIPSVSNNIMNAAKTIRKYIQDSDGLEYNTILYRGGHWDIGSKIGDVKSTPLLNSTSYHKSVAQELGIDMEEDKPNRYMITVYAPKGTKGCMVNAKNLRPIPEHEYLLDKGQKYIVLDVDDNHKTASILLINE